MPINHPGGPGRPLGSQDFRTRWFLALEKIAQKDNANVEELEKQVFQKLYDGAMHCLLYLDLKVD